jgi:hypothetical protein
MLPLGIKSLPGPFIKQDQGGVVPILTNVMKEWSFPGIAGKEW